MLFAPQAFHLWGDGSWYDLGRAELKVGVGGGRAAHLPLHGHGQPQGQHASVSPGVREAELALLLLPDVIMGKQQSLAVW